VLSLVPKEATYVYKTHRLTIFKGSGMTLSLWVVMEFEEVCSSPGPVLSNFSIFFYQKTARVNPTKLVSKTFPQLLKRSLGTALTGDSRYVDVRLMVRFTI